ncbi:NAD-dependent epimerase/dehydratase family protein [Sagittula salina]|uniref:SDR family oxidoreductase n=1 Tax=Sagittula salina TaxID=2820268 RepID=A0A940MSR1_9RHOB|nr:SDR family oxidoreductase [Sagittula salina]MBP0483327.1 SDR family oxidoreductase [Sagittula salina]
MTIPEIVPEAARIDPIQSVLALWGAPGRPQEHPDLAMAAMDLAQAVGAGKVVHLSSAAVYGPVGKPVGEGAPLRPSSDYGRAKVEMEERVRAWTKAHPSGPKPVILRVGNVAGADSLFTNLRTGGRITLDRFADGQGPRRSYIGPDDLSRALAGIVSNPDLHGVFNLAAPRATSMVEIALATGAEVLWRPAPPEAQQDVVLDVTRLTEELPGFHPESCAQHLVDSARRSGVWP